MSSGNLTGLAAIVGRSRNQEPEQIDQDETPAAQVPREAQLAAAPKRPGTRKAKPEPAEPTGAKYSDPERVQLKAYVRRTTKVDAVHKWQREGRGDVSDLIETLLTKYLSS